MIHVILRIAACLVFHMSRLITIAWLLVGLPLSLTAGESVEFVRDIQPILQTHCADCHGAEKQNGGLRFDDLRFASSDTDSGKPAIVSGDAQASELVRRIKSDDEDIRMPPEGDRLAVGEISVLSKWIAEGAVLPTSPVALASNTTTSSHWSFQPLSDALPPAVTDASWARNPIDCFIQARREAAGLVPSADADPATLIRRASYGLTGLPPTPDEVATWEQQVRLTGLELALAESIERLLAKPSYGERWGRHWMDWVRYADTAGDNSDYPIPQAYLYRNYIIDSLNADVPYDRFLIEQLAGDLLPAASQQQANQQAIATGYLAMARRFGSLLERYPWHLTIEDTIDNMGRTMMGLTVACARCHDHKFDPISTRDYYGLYGIFASTQYPMPGLELFQSQRDFVPLIPPAEATAALAPYQATTDKLTAELEESLANCRQQSLENARDVNQASLEQQRELSGKLDAMLLQARKAGGKLADHLKTVPVIPTAYAAQDAKPLNASIQIKGEPDKPGAEVPRKFPDVLGAQTLPPDVAKACSGRLQLAQWIASPDNPLTARVIVNRVWQRHFGEGLVRSTSDFGIRGELPTHPELLDWLTSEFIDNGWSIKHLQRLIMTSHTYRLSSQDQEHNLAHDPGNHLYWKFNRQRLDAESIRDTLLLLSGSLDPTPQSEPYPFPVRTSWEFTQHHPFKDDYPSNKRSVYLMTKRLTAKPYFQTFDGPDPNVCTSDRDQSVTALQALYFVNDEFVHEQANRLADVLMQGVGKSAAAAGDDQVSHAFNVILCRQPTADEEALLSQHIGAVRARLDDSAAEDHVAMASLVRSLLRLNEFLYLD